MILKSGFLASPYPKQGKFSAFCQCNVYNETFSGARSDVTYTYGNDVL